MTHRNSINFHLSYIQLLNNIQQVWNSFSLLDNNIFNSVENISLTIQGLKIWFRMIKEKKIVFKLIILIKSFLPIMANRSNRNNYKTLGFYSNSNVLYDFLLLNFRTLSQKTLKLNWFDINLQHFHGSFNWTLNWTLNTT